MHCLAWVLSLLIFTACVLASTSASSDEAALKFYLLGDWGKGGNSGSYWNKGIDEEEEDSSSHLLPQAGGGKTLYQAAVAKAMGDYGNQTDLAPSFLVALGDNFYTNGVTSATDQS
jgi:hypothetical protein